MYALPSMTRPFRTKQIAFKKVHLTNTFGEYLAENGKTQARIAETEKYAHVTFFFNGGVEEPNRGRRPYSCKIPEGCYL